MLCYVMYNAITACRTFAFYIWKTLTNREMVNFQKWYFFSIFLYTFTLNCDTTGAQECLLSMFCFICSEQCIRIISSHKKYALFSVVFKKSVPNSTTPTFQEVASIT